MPLKRPAHAELPLAVWAPGNKTKHSLQGSDVLFLALDQRLCRPAVLGGLSHLRPQRLLVFLKLGDLAV
jgi:hypothetical protein